jgi:hypothetical protein
MNMDVHLLSEAYKSIREQNIPTGGMPTGGAGAVALDNMAQQVPGQLAHQAGAAVNTMAGQMKITPVQQTAIQNVLTAFGVPAGSNIGKTVENLILKMVQKPQ